LTGRLLGAGKVTVTVPAVEEGLPWEFCTVYWKVFVVAVVGAGERDTAKPP
jgi:hypothetical protein